MSVIIDRKLVRQIAERAANFYKRTYGTRVDPAFIEMEIAIVHKEIRPLRLQALADADDFNFIHDVAGIHHHLDLGARKLRDCFVPRYTEYELS
jgi:hypothetical protein